MDGTKNTDTSGYVEIADGTYWVGLAEKNRGFQCNPYLIVDGDEAVLIDGGSRNEFSTVMLKIMRTGTNPQNITRLIYQHYDPDLCGSIPHMEALIGGRDLKIISHRDSNTFIAYYSARSPMQCVSELGFRFEFSGGRRLEFIQTPYCHTPGSFVTYDTKTKVLFSSDIFGSYDDDWSLYSKISERCAACRPSETCPVTQKGCPIDGIVKFHTRIMPSTKALRYSLAQIDKLDVSLIAPQHGSILYTRPSQRLVIERLGELPGVGIDAFPDAKEVTE